MRNVKVAVAFSLLALAGCTATDNAPFGQSSTSATTTTTTASPSAPTTLSSTTASQPAAPPPQTTATPLAGGASEVPAAQVDASTLPDVYDKQVSASADGRTVQVHGVGGGCKVASAEVTAQSGDQVLITLVTTYYPPTNGACTQELRSVPLNVTLDAPLGSRRVVLESRDETA
jgi:hypothetical protein